MRDLISPDELVDQIQLLVRRDPIHQDLALPPLDVEPRDTSQDRANWAVGPFSNWEANAQQRGALYRAIGHAKERFDVRWDTEC